MSTLLESPLAPVAEARVIVGDLNELAEVIEEQGFDDHREVVEALFVSLKYNVELVGGSLPVWVERQMLPSVRAAWTRWVEANGLNVEEYVMVWIRRPELGDLDPNLPIPLPS